MKLSFTFLSLIILLTAIDAATAQQRSGGPSPILVGVVGSSSRGEGGASNARPLRRGAVPVSVEVRSVESQIFQMLNDERRANGLSPLVWDDNVAQLARGHSQNMATYQFFSHRGVDGQTVDGRAIDYGLSNWRAIGENIASMKGYDKPFEVAAENWLKSPLHRKNIMSDRWNQSAIGVAVSEDGTYYFTQVFMLR